MTPQQIIILEQGLTSLGNPPSSTDWDNFDARADDLLDVGLPRLVMELTAVLPLIPDAVTQATQAAALATTNGAEQVSLAGEQVALAAAQAINANKASLAALALANYKGTWSSLSGPINTPASVAHAGEFWVLLSNLANVSASVPSVNNPAWLRIGGVSTDGTGAHGSWAIDISGKAATAGAADTAVNATNATNATTAVTQAQSDNDTSIATTAFVRAAIMALPASAPLGGAGTTGTWPINITGQAGTVNGTVDALINGVTVGRGHNGGQYNTALGHNALLNDVSTLTQNTAIGCFALNANTTGSSNVAVGMNSLAKNTTGDSNVGVGQAALAYNVTGVRNTALGHGAAGNSVGMDRCTGVGYLASAENLGSSNCTALGHNAQVTASNQVQLGDANTTTYVYGTVQNRSDLRDKAQVRGTVLGTAFITSLRPVDYKWDMRDDYRPARPDTVHLTAPRAEDYTTAANLDGLIDNPTGLIDTTPGVLDVAAFAAAQAEYTALDTAQKATMAAWLEAVKQDNLVHDGTHTRGRYHHGFIAQEVQSLIKSTGQDFGGFQDHGRGGGHDVLSIGYDELIAPLIKCVQELHARINILEAK